MAESTFTDKNIDRIRNIHHDNFLDYLSSAYEVLRKIFSYLSLDDLEIVSKAFEKWKPVVETAKRERTAIDSFIFSFKCEDCKMRSEANFCLTFFMEDDDALEEKLQKHLRENAEFVMVESRAGVIGTPNDYSRIVQQRSINFSDPPADTPIATHLRIPSFPDVGIKTLVRYKNNNLNDFIKSCSIPENTVIKGLIILTKFTCHEENEYEERDDFLYYLTSSQGESFAVGGCLIDSFPDDPEALKKYIIFYGDNVETASVVLERNILTQAKIESKITKFKSVCPRTDKGVIFVFRCCTRNNVPSLSGTKNSLIKWEGEALMKYFSSTPIVGCYGYGEYGRNFPENESLNSVAKRRKPKPTIWHYNLSTSIVYVGFKK